MPSSTPNPSQLPLFHVVGFSGHRQLPDAAGAARVVNQALESLRQESTGEWVALSSVATGGDLLFVAQARALGLSWHAILPLPKAEFAKDFTPAEWQTVEETLKQAEHVRVITENGSREDAYLDCGMETVNGADVLLAIWDGQAARGKGGTADVVEYARSLNRPVIIIDPDTLETRRENFTALTRSDASLAYLNHLPSGTTGWGGNPFKAPDFVFAFQQKADFAASHGAPQFRRLIVSTVLLHVVATIVAAAALSFDLHVAALPWVKLLCLIGALGVALTPGRSLAVDSRRRVLPLGAGHLGPAARCATVSGPGPAGRARPDPLPAYPAQPLRERPAGAHGGIQDHVSRQAHR